MRDQTAFALTSPRHEAQKRSAPQCALRACLTKSASPLERCDTHPPACKSHTGYSGGQQLCMSLQQVAPLASQQK